MAYSINPNLVKARAIALKMHIVDGLPLAVVARRCGIHRTTLWRWVKKWHKLNQRISGLIFMNNDMVNLTSSIIGGLIAFIFFTAIF